MKNQTKLKRLMAWLEENGIEYKAIEEWRGKYYRWMRSDLFIPKYIVSVKIDDERTQKWYWRHRSRNPVVIRDTDTPKFVIEKVKNAIATSMIRQQKHYMREQKRKLNENK